MARYVRSIDVPTSPEATFDYMARFSNAEEWDPGVAEAEMVTPAPVGPGSAFVLMVKAVGRRLPFRYEVAEYERPHSVTLVARRSPLVSRDTITVRPTSAGAQLTYDADLRLTGPARIFDPVLALAFRRIGDRALAGLEATFARGIPARQPAS